MSYTLVLNSNNISNNNTNSQWTYKFQMGGFKVKNMEMCVSGVTVPYSWFNVSSYYNNYAFQYTWWNGVTYTVTLPDGFYLISDINNYLEQYFISQNHYLISANGKNVYFLVLVENITYYAIQLLAFVVPTSAQASSYGYIAPSGWAGYPTTATTPTFVIPNTNFTKLIGFQTGSYPLTNQNTNYSINSTFTPTGSTVTSLILSSNIVDNPVTIPADILDSFPINALFGSNITYEPSFEKWVKISDGTYSTMIINMTDQNSNLIYAEDPASTITMMFREMK